MKYNIILEGCDRVGKSTVKDILCNRGDILIATHFRSPGGYDEGIMEYNKTLTFLNNNEHILYDRWALGERVYGPLLRGYYPDYMDELESRIAPHNYLFLLMADRETIESRWDSKGIDKSHIGHVLKAFINEFNKSKYPKKYIIDTEGLTPDEVADKIMKIIKEDQK